MTREEDEDQADFMSPFQAFLGFSVVRWEDGLAELKLVARPELLNRTGVLHGGVVATLLDTAGGIAGCFAPEDAPHRHARTISLTTQFIAPANGAVVLARGQVTGGGRRVFFSEIVAEAEDGSRIAQAVGSYRRVENRG
ncbi:MAG: PaaI family thioesterase [Magnetovibrionaceae bacterium]